MLRLGRKKDITLNAGDNAIIDVKLCGGDQLVEGDLVIFRTPEEELHQRSFIDGVAKILIHDFYNPVEGHYCVHVQKRDGRRSMIASGKFIRKVDC